MLSVKVCGLMFIEPFHRTTFFLQRNIFHHEFGTFQIAIFNFIMKPLFVMFADLASDGSYKSIGSWKCKFCVSWYCSLWTICKPFWNFDYSFINCCICLLYICRLHLFCCWFCKKHLDKFMLWLCEFAIAIAQCKNACVNMQIPWYEKS